MYCTDVGSALLPCSCLLLRPWNHFPFGVGMLPTLCSVRLWGMEQEGLLLRREAGWHNSELRQSGPCFVLPAVHESS